MKSSTLKQLLKSSKDGLTLTIQRQSGISHTPSPSPSSHRPHHQHAHHHGYGGVTNEHALLPSGHDSKPMFLHPGTRSNGDVVQSPGTPKSNVSETSMGYHSLTHSVPEDISNGINHSELIGADSATGQLSREQTHSLTVPDRTDGFTRHRRADGYGYTSPQPLRSQTFSGPPPGGLSKSSYRTRPADFYPPRRNTTSNAYSSRNGTGVY